MNWASVSQKENCTTTTKTESRTGYRPEKSGEEKDEIEEGDT